MGASMSSEVIVTETGPHYQQEIRAGAHRYYADEPASMGGADSGPAPFDFLMSALGACTSMTLRLYDPGQDRWAIYWINSRDGQLQPPVYGRFENGRGVFAGDDFDDGKPVKVLFDWSGTDTETPRWSQAFSYDDGATWETNWIMEFRRPGR